MHVPFLPPTSNKIYFTNWKKKLRVKTSDATTFENRFSEEVVPKYLPWISQMPTAEEDDTIVYAVHLDLFFPKDQVLNKGFFQKTKFGQRKAKTRYKKMDTGNRFKLIVDCLAKALAVDDSHFWVTGGRKLIADYFNVEPGVDIYVMKQDPLTFGVTGGY